MNVLGRISERAQDSWRLAVDDTIDMVSDRLLVSLNGVLVDKRNINRRMAKALRQRLEWDAAWRCECPSNVAKIMEPDTGYACFSTRW